MERVRAEGPTAAEIERGVAQAEAHFISRLQTVGGFGGKAVTLAQGALYSNDPAFYRTQLARYGAATPASVTAAMQRWLTRPVVAIRVPSRKTS